ncbi:MAG: chaperone modulator CbpM [Rectinemataceae bacterium]
MTRQTQITLSQVCEYFHIDPELIQDFAEFGLYPTVILDGEIAIQTENLDRLRKIISLHEALGINKEGIEIILDLREKISALQRQVELLQNEVNKLKRELRDEEPAVLKSKSLLIEISSESFY